MFFYGGFFYCKFFYKSRIWNWKILFETLNWNVREIRKSGCDVWESWIQKNSSNIFILEGGRVLIFTLFYYLWTTPIQNKESHHQIDLEIEEKKFWGHFLKFLHHLTNWKIEGETENSRKSRKLWKKKKITKKLANQNFPHLPDSFPFTFLFSNILNQHKIHMFFISLAEKQVLEHFNDESTAIFSHCLC